MNNLFVTKVKYTDQLDNGSFKRVTRSFLVGALTFGHAESRIFSELGNSIKGEFNLLSVNRADYHDIFAYDDADVWFKVKMSYETTDMDASRTKKVNQNFLVCANSVKEAYERIKECLSSVMVDYKIDSVVETPIRDVFPFQNPDESCE